jgi:hypothetical protein
VVPAVTPPGVRSPRGTVRIRVPRRLAHLPLVATLDGRAVSLDTPTAVVGERAELCLSFSTAREGAVLRAAARCVVPIVDGAETVVGW